MVLVVVLGVLRLMTVVMVKPPVQLIYFQLVVVFSVETDVFVLVVVGGLLPRCYLLVIRDGEVGLVVIG